VKVTKNISNLASKRLINIDLVVISFALHFTQTNFIELNQSFIVCVLLSLSK